MLAPQDLALIKSALEPIDLPPKFQLHIPNAPIEFCYFPAKNAVASVVAESFNGERLEAGLIGYEGFTGFASILGNATCPTNTFIQIPGKVLRIHSDVLRQAMLESPTLSTMLLRYVHVFLIQTMQTALMNGRANIGMRLARWILMASDRANSSSFPVTHQFLALMLGVRRAGITIALHELEGQGWIRSRRGEVIVKNRNGLEAFADWTYGVPEAQYRQAFNRPLPTLEPPINEQTAEA
jgi:CRP-like cAMP-binding protein